MKKIINEFDAKILNFYNPEDLATLQFHNRMGKLEPFRCTSLSIAVITNQNQQFTSVEQLSDAVTRVKKQCKKISASCYLINEYKKRNLPHSLIGPHPKVRANKLTFGVFLYGKKIAKKLKMIKEYLEVNLGYHLLT